MTTLHIVNANFEAELEGRTAFDLEDSFGSALILLQLQFLPCLYKEKDEGVGVSMHPSDVHHHLHLLSDTKPLSYTHVESWGCSQMIERWAKKRGLIYKMPAWQVVKEVNSKAFSFQESPELPYSALITNREEAHKWILSFEGEKVFKSCFGVSGKGHLRLPQDGSKLEAFLAKEFSKGLPVIAEPWVNRTLDFSTQWFIHSEDKIDYLGATVCISDDKGRYRGNQTGDTDLLFGINRPHLEKHLEIVEPILKKMGRKGFFGNVGIDAMIYNKGVLHPVVEINARKTMGWFCIKMQKRYFPKQVIAVSYEKNEELISLLPRAVLKPSGDELKFTTSLTIKEVFAKLRIQRTLSFATTLKENNNGYTEN